MSASTPRHELISNRLREAILEKEYRPGEKLPSESELTDRFDVSRITVRHALDTLMKEGLIYKKQGLGTFVSKKEVTKPLIHLHDFMEEIAKAGYEGTSKVLSFKKTKAEDEITELLDLESESPVVLMDRVRLGDGQPLAFDKTWFPLEYGKLLITKDLEHKTIYKILEDEFDIPIVNGRYQIKAANADSYIADHLNITPHTALLLVDRISYTRGQKKVYYQQRYIRPDKMAYQLFLERSEHTDHSISQDATASLKEFIPVFHGR